MGITGSCTTALALLALLASAAQTPDSARDRAQQLTDRAAVAAKRADGAADALGSYREALELWRSAGDRSHEGHTLIAIGRLEALSGNKAQARDTFSQAVTLFQELDDAPGESDARYGLARQQSDLHDTQGAIVSYEKTIDLRRRTGDRFGLALAVHNLAAALGDAGDTDRALDRYDEALEIRRSIDDRPGIGYTLYGIATIHWARGDIGKAIDTYQHALENWRSLGDKSGEANTLNSMGLAYEALGDHRRAATSYRQALERWRVTKNAGGEAYTLSNIAMADAAAGRDAQAMTFYQTALGLLKQSKDLRGHAYVLHNLGDLETKRGRRESALRNYEESLALKRQIGDRFGEAYTLQRVGEALLAAGDASGALERDEQALSLHRAVGDRPGEAAALAAIARAREAHGDLGDARASMADSLRLVERLRIDVANDDLRASYFSTKQDYYEYSIALLMRSYRADPLGGFDRQALQVSERTRSRVLLERLAGETGGDSATGTIAASRRDLTRRIKEETARVRQAALSGRTTQPSQLEALLTESDHLDALAIRSTARSDAIATAEPLSIDRIQREVLAPDTLLLEYSLGKDRSYGWLVGTDTLTTAILPPRARIERSAHRYYSALTARATTSDATADARAMRLQQADAELPVAARALAAMVLGPFESRLRARRIVIVADGFLQAIPFAALPLRTGVPLLERHEIVHTGSASLLAAIRTPSAAEPTIPTVAVLGDPVFACDDTRTMLDAGTIPGRNAEPRAPCASHSSYPRLRYTRIEATSIAAIASHNTQSTVAMDFEATRATLERPEFRTADILHFATHAVVDEASQAKSGIILSLVDRAGHAQDGFLGLPAIAALDIKASTVVLSACRTALGVPLRGEGLIGFTRSFFLAGSKRVVATAWEVRDRATAELMGEFYRAIYERESSPAAALRSAQLAMRATDAWSHPFYWAGFEMIGDWR